MVLPLCTERGCCVECDYQLGKHLGREFTKEGVEALDKEREAAGTGAGPALGWGGDRDSHLPSVSDPRSLPPLPNATADVKAFRISLGRDELFLPRRERSLRRASNGPPARGQGRRGKSVSAESASLGFRVQERG